MTPHHGAIDLLQGGWQPQIRQRFRITRLQMVGIEDVIFTTDEKDYLLVWTFIYGIDVVGARRQIEQPGDFRWVALVNSLIAYSPQILRIKKKILQ